jgi:hypothetical protein
MILSLASIKISQKNSAATVSTCEVAKFSTKAEFKGRLHETAKFGLIFAVRLILSGHQSDFCQHPTVGHHITQNQMER